jgi:hypothetical protein
MTAFHGAVAAATTVADLKGGVQAAMGSSHLMEFVRFDAGDVPTQHHTRDALLARGLPAHLVHHLATMANLHRAGRYDRMSDDVLTLTGQVPLSVQEFVRKNAATFTASAKAA